MPVALSWNDVALRLALTLVAGTLIGLNRGEHGNAAGLRTTLLVCLAASVAMIQVNLLLGTAGKPSDSFITLDLMRLPLGILSGMGFIGAGAIVRRDDLAIGVTTAATLWFVTVIGLCFGGGQNSLGLAALVLGIMVLWGLKFVERNFSQTLRGTLSLSVTADGPTETEIEARLRAAGYGPSGWAVEHLNRTEHQKLQCEIKWRGRRDDSASPPILKELAQSRGVLALRWKPRWRP